MTFRLLSVTHAGQPAAAVELAQQLAGQDLALHGFGAHQLLMPAALWQALEEQYGAQALPALLQAAGLKDLGPIKAADALGQGLAMAAGDDGLEWLSAGWHWLEDMLAVPPPDWHLDTCQVREAWEAVGTQRQHPVIDWQGLRVGQVDTGYTEHPALGFPAGSWVATGEARTFDGDTVTPGALDAMRGLAAGHGTSSGSILCGADPKDPYFGVAPRLPVVPVRVDDCYILDHRAREFEAAVHYLVDEAKVALINVSMGTFKLLAPPPEVKAAVDYCYEHGVPLIAAAGNLPVPGWPAYPAALPRAIAVAGVTHDQVPWGLSSSGDWVTLSAPAKQVRRASVQAPANAGGAWTYDYTARLGGTTLATVMVTGAAALWMRQHGPALAALQPWQRVETLRTLLRQSATVPPGWQATAGYGAGILNVARLLATALPDPHSLQKR